MKIPYRKVDDETRAGGFSFYPLVTAFIRNGVNMRPVLALVDSGACDCIFAASLGEVLGIDVPSGKSHEFRGFDDKGVQGFVHKVNLQVAGFQHWIEIDAVFIDSEPPSILGQQGFFENYQIVFERWTRQIHINTKTDAIFRNRRGYGRR